MSDNPKHWYQSKTVIFNVVSGIVAIAGSLSTGGDIPPNVQNIFATIVTVGNVILRFVTKEPIGK